MLGTREDRWEIKDPIRNFHVNCFSEIGKLENDYYGMFDEKPVQDYADTIIMDLFDIEGVTEPVRGIEKEGVLILGAWTRVYHYLTNAVTLCRDGGGNDEMLRSIDQAAALWIGRLQLHGDNAHGTMLYNFAERIAIHFNQDYGEAEVNKKFLSILTDMREEISNNMCTKGKSLNPGYDRLYKMFNDLVGVMYIPVIQSLIHYIAVEAKPKLIELYLLAILPQLRSCNRDYLIYSLDFISELSSGSYDIKNLTVLIPELQSMFSCFGITCGDVGHHASGIGCKDTGVELPQSFDGYTPKSDIENFDKFDRDVNQMSILLEERNLKSAKELYLKGKNVLKGNGYSTLQDLAMHKDLTYEVNDKRRIYNMYVDFYDNDPAFADKIVMEALEDSSSRTAQFKVPTLMKALVMPQYAMRSMFEAYDACKSDAIVAEKLWDNGIAVLVGSAESKGLVDSGVNGMSWWTLTKEYCNYFDCERNNGTFPLLEKMQKSFELGRVALQRSDCSSLKSQLLTMESLMITPIVLGLLYHSGQRSLVPEADAHYGAAFAFGKAALPVINVRKKADVDVIGDTLFVPGDYDATNLWTTLMLSIPGFGINCKFIGRDTLGVLGEVNKSFCDYVDDATEFPTAAPNQFTSKRPTRPPTRSPTAEDSSSEISQTLIGGYQISPEEKTKATNKAKIALDLRDFLALRGHFDIEHDSAKKIYKNGKYTNAADSLESIGLNMKENMANDPYYNFYRNAFLDDPLFAKAGGEDDSFADIYAHKIVSDALEAGDVDFAYEAAVCTTIWMQVVHLLNQGFSRCNASSSASSAAESIDFALAYYVGVGQTKGKTDGYLLYSLAQKSANVFGTVDATGEADANRRIMQHFKDAKKEAMKCDGGPDQAKELHSIIVSMLKDLNIPLIQSFVHQLQVGAQTDKASFHAILYGLAVLPQIATCKPTDYQYLTNEITENGLDVANVEKLMVTVRSAYDCFGISCEDVEGNPADCGTSTALNTFAGFTPIMDVRQAALIDRDILKIKTLLSQNAVDAALTYYELGSDLSEEGTSLRHLARDPTWKQSTYFQKFKDYHNRNDGLSKDAELYADETIMSAFLKEEPFDSISNDARNAVILRSLQTLVLFPAAIGYMHKASSINDCTFSNWDKSIAFLVGSLEGPQWGGDRRNNGVGMYGLAKEMCDEFDTCTTSGNAQTNERLIEYFSSGEDLISGGSCGDLRSFVEGKVFPTLLTSLIQGIIGYAEAPDKHSDTFIMTQAVLPVIEALNENVANTIKSSFLMDSSGSVQDAINAFAEVLPSLDVSCTGVGAFDGNKALTLCKDTYDPDQSTDLSDGLYITSTFVEDRAKIGLDIKMMTDKLNDGFREGAKLVYNMGWNSELIDEDGKKLGTRSIAGFSNYTAVDMSEEPIYNLYQYALVDVMNEEVHAYAHNIVLQFFDNGIFSQGHKTLAAEAAVALNIWGYIVHKLYDTVARCAKDDFLEENDGVQSIDEAVAYWIGEGQETGSETKGYLLYRLAEEGGELFDLKESSSQSRTNTAVLKLFKEAALHLTFNDSCGNNDSIISSLNSIINKLVAYMTVPLIQHLLYNLKKNDRGRVKIYANAVVPLLAPCSQETFEYLKNKLLVSSYEATEVDTIISSIQSTYSCLGLKCRDIGNLQEYSLPRCIDRAELEPLAGFTPSHDVREYSDVDIDIRFIDIMMAQGADDAAMDIYKFGKHSLVTKSGERRSLSLRELAITTKRMIVPSFELFQNYYSKTGLDYADDLIRKELLSPVSEGSIEQKQTLVVGALKYEVLYFAALQQLFDAADGCKSEDQSRFKRAMEQWDIGAAMIIGSTQNQGADANGDLLYKLGASLCKKFNTCDPRTGEAKINEEIESALFAGKYLLQVKSCDSLVNYASNIEKALQVSLIQATLSYAVENSQLPQGTDNPSLAAGYIFSRSILPYISEADADAAGVIQKNLNYQFMSKPVIDGPDAVFNAFRSAISKMSGIDCKSVGYLDSGKGVCSSNAKSSANKSLLSFFVCATVVGVILCTLL